jgi:signal peptidase I
VSSGDMSPELKEGDFVFGYRLPYGLRIPLLDLKTSGMIPEKGQIVSYRKKNEAGTRFRESFKRILGLPGDVVEVRKGKILINDQPLNYTDLNFQSQKAHLGEFSGPLKLLVENLNSQQWTIQQFDDLNEVDWGPKIIPPESVFIISDKRSLSSGELPWSVESVENLEAELKFIWFSVGNISAGSFDSKQSPKNDAEKVIRWERIFQSVH